MGNWEFITTKDSNMLYNNQIFTVIIIIQGIGIVLNFIKGQMIDVTYHDDPREVALFYIKGPFIYDAISIVPYNILKKNLLILRFVKLKKFNMYQNYINDFLLENSSAFLLSNETMMKIVEFLNMTV